MLDSYNILLSMLTLIMREIVILQDESLWPILPPLPSYGRGREHPGPRYGSLIHGQHLEDVVITGRVTLYSHIQSVHPHVPLFLKYFLFYEDIL